MDAPKISFVVLRILLVAASCSDDMASYSHRHALRSQNTIYGKILDDLELEDTRTIILLNDSTRYLDITRIRNRVTEHYPDIHSTLFSVYEEINQSSQRIEGIPPSRHRKVYFSGNYNGTVRDKDVYGLISFSKIAYNDRNDQAIVAFEDYGAPLVAAASLAYFKYANHDWELVGYSLIWIA
jgi:hypothetical protein